jgi:hypothetical protein
MLNKLLSSLTIKDQHEANQRLQRANWRTMSIEIHGAWRDNASMFHWENPLFPHWYTISREWTTLVETEAGVPERRMEAKSQHPADCATRAIAFHTTTVIPAITHIVEHTGLTHQEGVAVLAHLERPKHGIRMSLKPANNSGWPYLFFSRGVWQTLEEAYGYTTVAQRQHQESEREAWEYLKDFPLYKGEVSPSDLARSIFLGAIALENGTVLAGVSCNNHAQQLTAVISPNLEVVYYDVDVRPVIELCLTLPPQD